jgi:hypothetical protein
MTAVRDRDQEDPGGRTNTIECHKDKARLPKQAGFVGELRSDLGRAAEFDVLSVTAATTAVSATGESTTGSATTGESTASCRCCASSRAPRITATRSGSYSAAIGTVGSASCISATSAKCVSAASVAVSTATVAEAATVAPAMTPAPAIPGAYAEEDAAAKPPWAVITIGRASIRVVGVITPFASRGTVVHGSVDHCRANSDTNSHLGLCCRCREGQSQ